MGRRFDLTRHGATVAVLATIATMSLLPMGKVAAAGDAVRGELLYDNHCVACHGSSVHSRDKRKATTRSDIENWIRRWQKELGLQWEKRDIDDVAEFLNKRYYHLENDS